MGVEKAYSGGRADRASQGEAFPCSDLLVPELAFPGALKASEERLSVTCPSVGRQEGEGLSLSSCLPTSLPLFSMPTDRHTFSLISSLLYLPGRGWPLY